MFGERVVFHTCMQGVLIMLTLIPSAHFPSHLPTTIPSQLHVFLVYHLSDPRAARMCAGVGLSTEVRVDSRAAFSKNVASPF